MALFGAGTLIDFGCGDGKALDKFAAAGFVVVGVDHIALRSDVVTACLWDLPASLPCVDYGFCADVMEHIPPEYVDMVLQGIARHVTKTAYFRISTIPDSMGALIGETLHLTVHSGDWWVDQLLNAFDDVQIVRTTPDHVIIVGRHA